MRLVVVILTIVSAIFAGTTVYLARELAIERGHSKPVPVAVATAWPALPARAPMSAATLHKPAQQTVSTPTPFDETEEQYIKKLQAEEAEKLLKKLADPEQRESLLAEYKLMLRNSYPRLAQAIGLSIDESERLITLLALQQVEQQERVSRCVADIRCNFGDPSRNLADPRDQEIADLLGAQRQQQFDTYKNSLMERESVTQFRSRLSDANRLPENKAEALITVLADERQKIHMEAAQRGAGMNGFGTGVGMVFTSSEAATPEAQIESARANSRRMRERAAEVLSAEQLRVFDDMQEELILAVRNQVRRKVEFRSTELGITSTPN